jgi:tetratricopeptide (TPR) repeat protein
MSAKREFRDFRTSLVAFPDNEWCETPNLGPSASTRMHRDRDTDEVTIKVLKGSDTKGKVSIEISDFRLCEEFAIDQVDVDRQRESAQVRAHISDNAFLVLKLVQPGGAETLRLDAVAVERRGRDARSDFVASSLMAMIGLAGSVVFRFSEVAGTHASYAMTFQVPPHEIASILQDRQQAFWIIVLETVLGRRFDLPSYLPGDEIARLSFAYHAITSGLFNFPTESVQIKVPASRESVALLEDMAFETEFRLGPSEKIVRFLDVEIPLGDETVVVRDGYISDVDRVFEMLRFDDGRDVEITIIPKRGFAYYVFDSPPSLERPHLSKAIERFLAVTGLLVDAFERRLANLSVGELSEVFRSYRNDPVVTFMLGRRYMESGEIERAIGILEWFTRFPQDVVYFTSLNVRALALVQLGLAYRAAGKLSDAEVLFRESLAFNAGEHGAQTALGVVLFEQSLWLEAEDALRAAFDKNPDDEWARRYLAMTIDEILSSADCTSSFAGKLSSARDALRKAFLRDPNDAHVRRALRRAEWVLAGILPDAPELAAESTAVRYISVGDEAMPFVDGTGISVLQLVFDRESTDLEPEAIARLYDALTTDGVYAALLYFAEHREELERLREKIQNEISVAGDLTDEDFAEIGARVFSGFDRRERRNE